MEKDFQCVERPRTIRGSNTKLTSFENVLLDSSLILTTFNEEYNVKMVQCGCYCQLYLYDNKRKHTPSQQKDDLYLEKIQKKKIIDKMFDEDKNINKKKEPTLTSNIQIKNIIRSKLECQRLAKANMEEWKSFITLTFEDNVTSIQEANKKFRYYIDKVQRLKKDFKYLCITEFQKRGAVHYHLLTNLKCGGHFIPKRKKKKLYNPNTKRWKGLDYYGLPYWNSGFSSAEPMNGKSKKVVGYISKYMTKDIDNRLFNRHRYFFSRNLTRPLINYLNLNNKKHREYYTNILANKKLIYENEYQDTYNNEKITFKEFL